MPTVRVAIRLSSNLGGSRRAVLQVRVRNTPCRMLDCPYLHGWYRFGPLGGLLGPNLRRVLIRPVTISVPES